MDFRSTNRCKPPRRSAVGGESNLNVRNDSEHPEAGRTDLFYCEGLTNRAFLGHTSKGSAMIGERFLKGTLPKGKSLPSI